LLPNDEEEQDRLDLQHHIFRLSLDGALYIAPIPKDVQHVLDIGCGTGIVRAVYQFTWYLYLTKLFQWAIEFADDHPSTTVLGIDISPIQPSYVPVNCSFRIDNIESDWVPEEKFDLIHSRAMVGAIKSWPQFFSKAFE
jgi:SAM-dependent methyltransferase